MERIDGCVYDYLAIYDGQTNKSRKIEQLCGLQFPDDVISTGQYLMLHFVSDDDVSGSGFNITYSFNQATSNVSIMFVPISIPFPKSQ